MYASYYKPQYHTSPAFFNSLMALISAVPPGMWYCFWFIFLGRGSSSGFHLAYPPKIALTPQVREPMWGFCQLLNISTPIMHFKTGEITTGWVQGPTGPLWDGLELKLPCLSDFHAVLLWLVGYRDILCDLQLVSVQSLCPSIPPKVWLCLFPWCIVTLVKGQRSLWGRSLGEILTVKQNKTKNQNQN